ncbi:MAG: VanZ family protein [Luteibaculaceae bacterium]
MVLKSFFRIIFNPFFSAFVILSLSLIPFSDDVIENKMPLEGDNFRYVKDETVYKFENGFKRPYTSLEFYFSNGNPPFGTPYKEGGILVVTKNIVEGIPDGAPMDIGSFSTQKKVDYKPWRIILNLDKVYHLLFYAWLTFCFYLSYSRIKPWVVFLLVFLFGLVIEVLQELLFLERSGSLQDVLFNSMGIILGYLLYLLTSKKYPKILTLLMGEIK